MMKKRGLSKRILAFVLSFMMVIALVPMNAITVKAEGVSECPHCGGTGFVCKNHAANVHAGEDYSNKSSCMRACVDNGNGRCNKHGSIELLSYRCDYCNRVSACEHIIKTFESYQKNADYHWKKSCIMCGEIIDQESHTLTNGKCSICGYACKHSLISSSVSYLANADYHWKKTCGVCGEIIDKESHTDTNNDGICDTCRYSSSSGAILPGNNNDEFKLTIYNIPSEGGSTYCVKMPISYSWGTSGTFTANPNPGYRFKGWYAMKSSNASGELGTCLSSEETYTITPSDVDTYKTSDSGLSKKTYSVYIAAVYEDSTVHTHSKGTHHAKVDATCNETGTLEYWECSGCDKNINDSLEEIGDITIPATGNHDFSNQGDGTHICADCGVAEKHDFLLENGTNNGAEKCTLCNVKNIASSSLDIKATSTTYTGKEQTAVIIGIEAENYTVTGNTATNAGKYTITLTGKGDYTGTREVEWTITKATPTVIPPTSANPKYAGESVELVNPGSTDFGKMLYSLDNDDYSEEIPCADKGGDYTVYYEVEGSGNWSGAAGSVEIQVPVRVDVTVVGDGSVSGYDPDEFYTVGTILTLTAEPNEDYMFTGWDDDVDAPAEREWTVLADAKDNELTVNFQHKNHDFSDEGICKICNYECTHQNAEGWTVEDGKCTSCGAEAAYPVDDEDKPVAVNKVPDQLWVTGIKQNLIYTGAKVEQPTMKVYWKNKLLVINQDYTVKYLNNIKAGTATVVITGKGNYAGTIKETYPIAQIDIGNAKAFDEEITIAANGRAQKPTTTFTIEAGGKTVTLKNGTDYIYTYPVIKDKGEYEVTITGKGNYKGTKTVKVIVVDKGVAVTKLTVKKIPNQTYRDEDKDGKGDQIIPDVVVMYGKKTLEKGTDYTVEAAGANTDIGTGTVTIVGISDNGYYGKRNVAFNIVGTPITKATVEGLVAETYTGNAINPAGYKLYIKATKTTGQIDLTEDKDYKVSVDKNVNAGTATVTFTGINGYSGVLKKTFKINKASMTDERISIKPIDAVQYQKNGAKPAITVIDGSKVLKENVDYTVKYTNNNALHDLSNDVKKPTVTITGKGNYVGTKSANFAIIGSSLSKDDITITATDIVASGKANTCKPVIKLTDNGVALKAGTDYETAVEYTYVNATKVKQIVNRVETEVEYAAGAKVNTADIIPAGTVIKATVKGKGFYADSKEVVFRYVAANIASAKVVIPNFVYTKKAITLDENRIQVTMVVNKKTETLKFGEDFEIIGYKNNVDKGTAKVTIRGLGNYGGTKEVAFKIVSKTLNHTVRLHNNDGSAKDVVKEINIPSGTMLPVNTFKVAGKKFAGWNTEADGSGKAYNDREAIVRSYLSMLIFGDTLDLYAQWE